MLIARRIYTLNKTVCVIDDETINNQIVTEFLSPEYQIFSYTSGEKFFHDIDKIKPDLILLDIVLPNQDGYNIIGEIKRYEHLADVPVIFLTSKSNLLDEVQGLKNGAVDYITKPFSPEILRSRLKIHLELRETKQKLEMQNKFLNQEVEKRVTQYKIVQRLSYHTLAQIIDFRDNETGNHILRTKFYVKCILQKLMNNPKYKNELDEKKIEHMVEASVFHDIGKVVIPDSVLLKTGKLSDEEWAIMKSHVILGKEAIDKALEDLLFIEEDEINHIDDIITFFNIARDIVLYHHERVDGNGYPYQLKGNEIPLAARVMAVADVFDALLSNRPYKKAWTFDEAYSYMIEQKNRHFDEDVIDAFVKAKNETYKIYKQYLLDL